MTPGSSAVENPSPLDGILPIITASAATVVAILMAPSVLRDGAIAFGWDWIPGLGIRLGFRIDALALLFALLISGIGLLIAIYARAYLRGHRDRVRFDLSLTLFMVSMLGLVVADDILLMFVFWELTSISSFLLIGFEHDREEARRAATQALLVTAAGGLVLLAGLLLLGHITGTYSISGMAAAVPLIQSSRLAIPIVVLVAIGAMTKSALFPFHFWLPNAMEAPTPVSAYLHSATMVKAGIYLIARMQPLLGGIEAWGAIFTIVGSVTAVFAAVLALRASDLKRLLAWSTVSTLGLLAFLLGLGTARSALAAILLLTAHAFYKGSFFMIAGVIDHETGGRDLRQLRGLVRVMPLVAATAILAAASQIGVPMFLGALAKEEVYLATLSPGVPLVWTAVAVVSSILLVVVSLRMAIFPFFGSGEPNASRMRIPWSLTWPPLGVALAGLIVGWLAVQHWTPLIEAAAGNVVRGAAELVEVTDTAAAKKKLLGMITMVGGALLTLLLGSRALRETKPGLADRLYDRSVDGLFAIAALQTRILQNGRLRYYLAVILGFTLLLLVLPIAQTSFLGRMPVRMPLLPDVASVVLAAGGGVIALFTRSRLIAVIGLGVLGLGVALYYMLHGAPDLAMTQVVVDILTVILFMLAFHRLPQVAKYSSPSARGRDAVLAILVGATMGLFTFLASTSTTRQPISSYFLEHAVEEAHGHNVVNVILVDFRALDTLGEISVLAVAALGVYGLLKLRPHESEEG